MSKNNRTELRIDARVVRQLGAELITDPEQALLELIKNAYDADADRCKVEIDTEIESIFVGGVRQEEKTSSKPLKGNVEVLKGRITVEDDGPGVPFADVKDRWLLISGSYKRPKPGQAKATTNKGRTPMGDKGIGRLGTMRLGDCVHFVSRSKGSDRAGKGVEFRWSDVDRVQTLNEINVREISGDISSGLSTRVMIDGLEEGVHWVNNTELQARLSKLISPFTDKHKMRVSVAINSKPIELQKLRSDLERSSVSRYTFSLKKTALGKFVLSIGAEFCGEFFGSSWDKKSTDKFLAAFNKKNPNLALNKIARTGTKSAWIYSLSRALDCEGIPGFDPKAYPGPFSGEIFNITFKGPSLDDSNSDPSTARIAPSGGLKSLFQKLAGVGIYRDGFGVRIDPDWLDISANVTTGGSWYGLRKANTVGYIAITAEENSVLVEKSDREGFVDGPSWRQFLMLSKKVLSEINDSHEALRREHATFVKADDAPKGEERTADKALSSLTKDVKNARRARSVLKAQEGLLKRAASLAENIKNQSSRDVSNFKKDIQGALKASQYLSIDLFK